MTAPHVQERGQGHTTEPKAESDWRGDLDTSPRCLTHPGRAGKLGHTFEAVNWPG
jgi:hypothetical protein